MYICFLRKGEKSANYISDSNDFYSSCGVLCSFGNHSPAAGGNSQANPGSENTDFG